MSTFKVGDKVKAYDFYEGESRELKGKIVFVSPSRHLVLETEIGTFRCHPKQCRRLRLVKKERRRVWVNPKWYGGSLPPEALVTLNGPTLACSLEFIEVRSKRTK